MVLKGRGKFPKKKPPERKPPTSRIIKIASLTNKDSSDKALELLHEIASLVSPIMDFYNLNVNLLCEMYPKDNHLLGLNVNRGSKICLRLRSPNNDKWFLDTNEIVGTMLHELVHNTQGPHNNVFYKLLDEYKDKYLELQIKKSLNLTSYPNNFNNKLKSQNKIQKLYTTKVSKLGSNNINSTTLPIRGLMLKAAERRRNDQLCCAENDDDKLKNVPNDDSLSIVDIVSLVSDDEDDDENDKDKDKESKLFPIIKIEKEKDKEKDKDKGPEKKQQPSKPLDNEVIIID